jgi:hypothetical protein
MNSKKNSARLGTALAAALLLLTSVTAFAQQPRGGEQITANLVDPAGTFGRHGSNAAPIVIHIDHYTSDVEAGQLKDILQQKGPDALRDALWNDEAGYLRIGGGLGYPIAAARSHPTDDGGQSPSGSSSAAPTPSTTPSASSRSRSTPAAMGKGSSTRRPRSA